MAGRSARYGLACLLCVSLLLAGCQGLAGTGGESGDATGTRTVTPAPVPAPERASAGVSAAGLDAGALAESHRAVLSGTNYTLTLTERLVIDGDPRRVTTRRRQVVTGARAYLVTRTERTREFAPSNYAGVTGYWYDGTTEFVRYAPGAERRYAARDSAGTGLLADPTEHRTVAGMVRAFDTAEATPRRLPNGTVQVRAERLSRSNRIPEPGYFVSPRNATLRLAVSPGGFVRRYRVAYTATIAGTDRQVRVVRELAVTDVGRTAVAPPAWAGEARSEPESVSGRRGSADGRAGIAVTPPSTG